MVDAMDKIAATFSRVGVVREQVIQGTPGVGFEGRLSFAFYAVPAHHKQPDQDIPSDVGR